MAGVTGSRCRLRLKPAFVGLFATVSSDDGADCYAELAVSFPSAAVTIVSHRQYSFCSPTDGWPGCVGLRCLVEHEDGIRARTIAEIHIAQWARSMHTSAPISVS